MTSTSKFRREYKFKILREYCCDLLICSKITIVHHHSLKTCVIVIIPTCVPLQLEMDIYFSRVNDIIKKRKISKRVQFLLQDVVDLRDNKWVPRKRQDTKLKTIDQIHCEAEDEEQMTKQLASQYIGGDGGDGRKVGVRG